MMKYLAVLLVFATFAAPAFAGGEGRVGTASADQTLVPVGARGIALGGSYLAGISGVDAIHWNPAGLSASMKSAEAMFSQMNIIGDVGVSYFGIGANFGGFGHLGFTLKSFSFGEVMLTNEANPDGNGSTYSPTFMTIGATYSRALTDRIRAGVTVSLVYESVDRANTSGALFDVGIQYSGLAGIRGLQLGVALRHLGGTMQYEGSGLYRTVTEVGSHRGNQLLKIEAASFNVPTSLELGMAYSTAFESIHSATFMGSFENNNFLSDQFRLGAEYSYMNMFFARGSYTFAGQSSEDTFKQTAMIYGLALGAGVRYDAGGVTLGADYAYRSVETFGGNHVVTVVFGF